MSFADKILARKSEAKKTKVLYQPLFPLNYDENYGPYRSIDSLAGSLQRNFEILLLTRPGSWPMKPDMGVGMATYLFENFNTDQLSNLQAKIRDQLAKFLPSVQLVKIELLATDDQKDNNFINIRLIYSILGNTIASSTTASDNFGNLNIRPEILDKDSSSFRDRMTNLQSHLTQI